MKITLSQQEIEEVVRDYVTSMVQLRDGTDMTIDFTAGRGENGLTASIDINYLSVSGIPAIQETPAPAKAPATKAATKPAPAAPAAPVAPAEPVAAEETATDAAPFAEAATTAAEAEEEAATEVPAGTSSLFGPR